MSDSEEVPHSPGSDDDHTRSEPDSKRSFRERYPSGWLALTRNESVPRMIDALLDEPPRREFTQSELARMADVSRQSVNRHLELLVEIEILDPVPDTSPQRYRFDPESPVSEAIVRLEGAMNALSPGSSRRRSSSSRTDSSE